MQNKPLAEILRPDSLEGFVGQEHLTGPEGIIRKLLQGTKTTGYFPSLILWGPPGCGKTTLARIISKELQRDFFEFSAVNASVKDIETKVGLKKTMNTSGSGQQELRLLVASEEKQAPLVFIDEIHRFNKAQQDAFLPHVEQGNLIFIGATTENPSFEVIGPLLSRTRVIVMKQLKTDNLCLLAEKALTHVSKKMDSDTLEAVSLAANGDARVMLNLIELAAHLTATETINIEDLRTASQRRHLTFDLQGEEYYNTISALHKSIRGSDPDAALYWLVRMLESGQDPLYIARRLIRCASEDIGLADPNALTLTVAVFQACDRLGMPECNLALAEAVTYLAKAPKNNSLYTGYSRAQADVQKHGNLPVPMHIRNAVTDLMKSVGYGKDYKYSHSKTGEKDPDINYLPDELKNTKYL